MLHSDCLVMLARFEEENFEADVEIIKTFVSIEKMPVLAAREDFIDTDYHILYP